MRASARSSWLATLLAIAGACGGAPAGGASSQASARNGKAYFVGTWTRADASYADAAKSTEAWRLRLGGRNNDPESDGLLEQGTFKGAFVAEPNVGPSGAGYLRGWRRDEHTLTLELDGAEEHLDFIIDGPDRWHTETGYFVRR